MHCCSSASSLHKPYVLAASTTCCSSHACGLHQHQPQHSLLAAWQHCLAQVVPCVPPARCTSVLTTWPVPWLMLLCWRLLAFDNAQLVTCQVLFLCVCLCVGVWRGMCSACQRQADSTCSGVALVTMQALSSVQARQACNTCAKPCQDKYCRCSCLFIVSYCEPHPLGHKSALQFN